MLAEKLWSFRRSSDSSVLGIGWQERAELVLPFRALQGRCEGAIRVASVYILANESFIGPFGRAVSEYFAHFRVGAPGQRALPTCHPPAREEGPSRVDCN